MHLAIRRSAQIITPEVEKLRDSGESTLYAPYILGADVGMDKENFNLFFGKTVVDPFEGIEPNRQLHLESGVFVPNDAPGVYPVFNMAHYKGVLLL